VFVNAINIVRAGVGTSYAIGVSKRFTIKRTCWKLPLNSSRFTKLALAYCVASCYCGVHVHHLGNLAWRMTSFKNIDLFVCRIPISMQCN
jgi:hypothetical protein